MRAVLLLVLFAILPGSSACGKSPTGPAPAESPRVLQGQTISAVDGVAAPSVAVQIGASRTVTTDSDGLFEVEVGAPGTYRIVVRGSGVVERETAVNGPSSERARLSLIPASFDLAAFDEMFRATNARLQRWVTRPALVVLASTMAYRNGGGYEYQATGEQLSDEEASSLVAQLTDALALLTGNAYTSFADVTVERPGAGARVNVARNGSIVVGRYTGIVSMAGTIGYGQWSELPNGTIVAGAMYLDRDFDRDNPRRHLLRIHELGHALGYQHVRSRPSIMNPTLGPDPTDFDRAGAAIAFQRPPGNHAPDVDPAASARSTIAVSEGTASWKTVYCR